MKARLFFLAAVVSGANAFAQGTIDFMNRSIPGANGGQVTTSQFGRMAALVSALGFYPAELRSVCSKRVEQFRS